MKKDKLVLISILGVVVLLGILIGTGPLKFSLYTSKVSSNLTSNWKNSKSIGRLYDSSEEVSFSSVPVIVVYKAKRVGDIHAENPLIVDISDKDFGQLWVPLFKKSNYNFTVVCSHAAEIKTNSVQGQLFINGEICLSGHYSITGICSSKIASNLIIDKAMNDIYSEVKKNVK